jgi:hypothetical protein
VCYEKVYEGSPQDLGNQLLDAESGPQPTTSKEIVVIKLEEKEFCQGSVRAGKWISPAESPN